jgi:hypothetical protein
MNSELLKHTSESTQILVLTWVLMGIRVPISFQSGFSKEEGFRVTGVLKTFKDKLFRGYIPPKPVARPGYKIVPLVTPKYYSVHIIDFPYGIGFDPHCVLKGIGVPILFQSCFSKQV